MCLAGTINYNSAQFEVFDMSTGNVLRQVVCYQGLFWVEATVQTLKYGGATGLEQPNRTVGLVPCPSEAIGWAPWLPAFSGQAS